MNGAAQVPARWSIVLVLLWCRDGVVVQGSCLVYTKAKAKPRLADSSLSRSGGEACLASSLAFAANIAILRRYKAARFLV